MNTKEPAAISAIVVAAVGVFTLIVLKRELSQEESAAIIGVVTLLGGFWTRAKVQPVA